MEQLGSKPVSERFTRRRIIVTAAIATAVIGGAGAIVASSIISNHESAPRQKETIRTPEVGEHTNITATVFWIGEPASIDNDHIHNRSSAWVEDWVSAYGGVDDPDNRCDFRPCAFTPKENPFYFALPYNDLDENGNQKASAKQIPWYNPNAPKNKSQVHDYWIEIIANDKNAYAQFGDVGPFGEDDFDYVFGSNQPTEKRAGLDLSPAAADYLGIDGKGTVSWKFVDAADVPDGPWKDIVNPI